MSRLKKTYKNYKKRLSIKSTLHHLERSLYSYFFGVVKFLSYFCGFFFQKKRFSWKYTFLYTQLWRKTVYIDRNNNYIYKQTTFADRSILSGGTIFSFQIHSINNLRFIKISSHPPSAVLYYIKSAALLQTTYWYTFFCSNLIVNCYCTFEVKSVVFIDKILQTFVLKSKDSFNKAGERETFVCESQMKVIFI